MKKVNLPLIAAMMIIPVGAVNAETVVDVTKQVINKTPYQVEVCYDQQVSGDKTGDAIKGAIIGGILGNNIKGEEGGGAIGAVLGAMAGHANSNATGGTRRVCNIETRYKEEIMTVYSHSVVSFAHEGREYQLKFQK